MSVPTWISWQTLTPYIIAIPGWIALWRTWRSERVRLRFRFRGVQNLMSGDPETGEEYLTPAIQLTVTNEGKRPLSIDKFTCELLIEGDARHPSRQKHVNFSVVALAQGEAHSEWIELPRLHKGQPSPN
jgi:hypothetical protein